jgi:hypothetical protein
MGAQCGGMEVGAADRRQLQDGLLWVRRLELAINRWLARRTENARPFRSINSAADIKRRIRAA